MTGPCGASTPPERRARPGSPLARAVADAERHQVAIYLLALAVAAAVGMAAGGSGPALEHSIEPVLAALLYATFLQVPFAALTRSFRDGRFLAALIGVNFAVVPLVVWALTLLLPDDRAVVLGVLLVLLTPCVDYVIVFSGLAGGSAERLTAAAPLLMLGQLLLLPLYLLLILGSDLAAVIEPGPFLRAFVLLIAIPLTLAAATQAIAARHRFGRWVTRAMTGAMVPLMAATLFVVVASQVPQVRDDLGTVAGVLPAYIAFPAIMACVGWLVARMARLDVPAARALTFSGATRNSLVVLPLALALGPQYAIAAVVVVTQTLVELVTMVIFVRLIPRLLPERPRSPQPG